MMMVRVGGGWSNGQTFRVEPRRVRPNKPRQQRQGTLVDVVGDAGGGGKLGNSI